MLVSRKTRYATRALVLLSRIPGEGTRSISELAADSGAPEKYLEAILHQLRGAGLVASTRGRSGGYRLAKDASSVSLAEVVEILDPEVVRPFDGSRSAAISSERAEFAASLDSAAWGKAFDEWLAAIEAQSIKHVADQAFGSAFSYSI